MRIRDLGKRAVIVIRLVDECMEKDNFEIEEEILSELSKGETKIPWFANVEKVTVTEVN